MATCATIRYYFSMPDKKRTAFDWEDVRYFVALARHGTLSATARELRVNHATVARRVASLEALLERTLFDRRADGYAVTADGKAVLDEARVMDDAAVSVLHRLDAGTQLSGLVRVTAGRVLAERFLIDRLREFHKRYPAIDLEVTGGSRIVSLARREADIALHYGSPEDSELIARRVAKIAFGLYVSPAYRDKMNAGVTPAFIGFDEDSDFVPEAAWLARQFGGRRFPFRANSQTTQAAAARAGFGVALLPRYVATDDPDLVEVWLAERLPERDVWLLIRRDLRKVPRMRVVADHLIDMFRRERRLMEGNAGRRRRA
jgi:DNA-binding transcriptional LysR family regulator